MISTQVLFHNFKSSQIQMPSYKLRKSYLSNFFFSIIHVVKTKLVDNEWLFGQFSSHSRAGYLHSYQIVLKLNLLMLNYFLNFKVFPKTLWESLIQRKLKKRKCYKSAKYWIWNTQIEIDYRDLSIQFKKQKNICSYEKITIKHKLEQLKVYFSKFQIS